MRNEKVWLLQLIALATVHLAGATTLATAQEAPPKVAPPGHVAPSNLRITLQEAKQKALANNKLLNMANLNAEAKAYAIKAARADYFPKISATAMYMHFGDDLGTVLTTRGRTLSGPLGRPLLSFPPTTVNAAVLNQNTTLANVGVVQPLTDLLKVRQGVKIAKADEQIALAQQQKGIREVASGVEQLYWGLLAARRLQAGASEGLRGAEQLAKTGTLEARTVLVEARQGLQQIQRQVADLQGQLNGLMDLPLDTTLELIEPTSPLLPYRRAEEVMDLALSTSPEMHEAHSNLLKVEAAVAAGKLDYVPSVAIVGGYVYQSGASYVQPNIGYAGVVATYTFVDWGKRKNVLRERQTLSHLVHVKLRQTEDEVRQKVQKAFRELDASQEDIKIGQEMLQLRKEAEKKAATPEALKNPTALLAASKARMLAEVEMVKADLSYRQAYVQVMSLIGGQ
jgi:outer membrane protein TolC